jgi:Flp pilus assembly CpaE family ATPase
MGDLPLVTTAMTRARAEPEFLTREYPAHESSIDTQPRAAGGLVAVCGLCGGAGASTLAFLIAREAARSGEGPVLLCDTGGPTGGLAAYVGAESPRSFASVADALARNEPLTGGLFAQADDGLRLLARGPELDSEGDQRAAGRLLRDAREAHPLTVFDCGTLARRLDRQVFGEATHVAWVLPATSSGVRRARRLLAAVPLAGPERELLVARQDAAGRTPPTAELAALAGERLGPLVLMPHVADLGERPVREVAEAASVTLGAIHGVLRR